MYKGYYKYFLNIYDLYFKLCIGGIFIILKLSEEYREKVLNYLSKEPNVNLFIIGDIEQHGFDKEFQEIWGKFDEKNNLKGVLLRYLNNFIPYISDLNEDVSDFKKIINSYKGKRIISGKEIIINKFKYIFPEFEEKSTHLCELKNNNNLTQWNYNIKEAREEDSQKIYDLMGTIEEFSVKESVNTIRSRIKDNSKIAYYIENENKDIITIAQITAENSKSAMVIGVATKKEYRGQGYMSQCLSKLCNDFINMGKTLCLFYDNPKAGKVYHRLGFKEIGIWTMLLEK